MCSKNRPGWAYSWQAALSGMLAAPTCRLPARQPVSQAVASRSAAHIHCLPRRRRVCRDMNQATSQDVFVGPYLDDPEVRAKFSKSYYAMTDGFLVGGCWVPCAWH